jgi:cysteine desulfurase
LKEVSEGIEEAREKACEINSYLRKELSERGAKILSPDDALPYVLNVSFEGFESETMLHCLEIYDTYVSTVSACSAKQKKVSYVLLEMGVDRKTAANAVRLSFSRHNTMEEAHEFIKCVDQIYEQFLVR